MEKKKPNGHPGPGAAYTFFSISNSNPEKLQQKIRNRDSPPSSTGLHGTLQPQLNSSPSLHQEQEQSYTDGSPFVENGSLPVENTDMHAGDSEKSLLMLPGTTSKASEIDEEGFKQYLLAQL
ncbi:MAG TPA: hypothetical protein VJ643_09110 [Nitrososphaera sp.]|nr:hypothetical protein [Nitrososphaera sp.]